MGQLLDGRFDELDEKDEALAATLAALLDGSRAYFETTGRLHLKAAFDKPSAGSLAGRKGRLAGGRCCDLAEDLLAKTVAATPGWEAPAPSRDMWEQMVGLCGADESASLDLPTCANFCLCVNLYTVLQHVSELMVQRGITDFTTSESDALQACMVDGKVDWISPDDFEEAPLPPPSVGQLAAGVNTKGLLDGLSSDDDEAVPPIPAPAASPAADAVRPMLSNSMADILHPHINQAMRVRVNPARACLPDT